MTKYKIALLSGDGVGPEISEATLEVLRTIQEKTGALLDIIPADGGDDCFNRKGVALPAESIETLRKSHACLKGPVGETAMEVIVKLRQMFDLYANIRPSRCLPTVECLKKNIDLVIVRENTEDLYKGIEFATREASFAIQVITEKASLRIAEYAFRMAEQRNSKRSVIAVHKSNVLKKTGGMFAGACRKVAEKHGGIRFSEMYVDAAAMNLIRNPEAFDVIVTTNMFGDILSDEAAQTVGGLGLAPSANIGDTFAIFEPVHGSAPDISGKGIANPISMVLTAKMMLEWLSQKNNDPSCAKGASMIENAVNKVLQMGFKTPDLGGKSKTDDVVTAMQQILSGR